MLSKKLVSTISLLSIALLVFVVLFVGSTIAPEEKTEDASENSALVENAVFGLSGFERFQSGSNKTFNNEYIGYVYTLGNSEENKNLVTLLATKSVIYVHVPVEVAEKVGIYVTSTEDSNILTQTFTELDTKFANGGKELSDLSLPYVFTTEDSIREGDTTYFFNRLIDGYYYSGCKADKETESKSKVYFCDVAYVLPAAEVPVAGATTWFDELVVFLTNLDYRPLWVSLKTALVAMIFIFVLGMLAAWRAMNVKSRWKSILDSFFTIPLVLPPTVCGFLLLVIFGKSSGFGQFLNDNGISLVFTWEAAVISAVVVGFPLMYRTVLGAFESLDKNMLDAARTLGWSEITIFKKLMLPLSWSSIAAGSVLAFARSMGEFGCTLFFAGNYAGVTQTMPIAIYFNWIGGSTDVAVFWVVVVILISFLVILFINLWGKHTSKFNRKSEID